MNCSFTLPTFFHLRGSVVFRIYGEVILCIIYALSMYYLINERYIDTKFDMPDNVISVLSVSTGMLLVFRTNTSYDRFWEGRKLWSDLTTHIRSLMRTIWVMIEDRDDSKNIVEKISAINLLIAFAYATKHYLREEYSYDEDDLVAIAGHLPQFFTPNAVQKTLEEQEKIILKRRNNDPLSEWEEQGKMPTLKQSIQKRKTTGPHGDIVEDTIASNIPLEITYLISSYVKNCKNRGLVDSPTNRVIDTGIGSMIYCLTCFERIRRTPIPMAYLVHLTHVTWIVLLFLPFQWVDHNNNTLDWKVIPIMGLTSFAMLGILGIGREIEDPFGYDYNDLNLDDYCKVLHKEAIVITSQPLPTPEDWMFSDQNHPIASSPELNAAELIKFPPKDIGKILFAGRNFKFSEQRSVSSVRLTVPDRGDHP